MTRPDPWPPRHLILRTPRLELRPDDDAGLHELIAVAHGGVHPPGEMPFLIPWTDAAPDVMARETLRHYWSQRAQLTPEHWWLHFLVRLDGRVIGVQSVTATDFGVTREIGTGSWVGLPYQRRGFGSEMRCAVLQLAFDHLGAVRARSSAFVDNLASLRVSARLGYRSDGSETFVRRGASAEITRLLLDRADFVRPDWTVSVEGVDGCRPLLGAG